MQYPNDSEMKVGDRVFLAGSIVELIDSTADTPAAVVIVTDEGASVGEAGSSITVAPRQLRPAPISDDEITHADRQVVLDKTWRRDIDDIIQRMRAASGRLNPGDDSTRIRSSRERSIAITKLQEAVMWLGMDLKGINEEVPGSAPNPYPSSKDPSTGGTIEPTDDGLKL